MAAKQYQTIAELFESDLVDIPNAMTYYEKSADLFKTEENNALVDHFRITALLVGTWRLDLIII